MSIFDKNLAIVLVAKYPAPDHVKTRLCPPLSHEQAAGIYACFLQDTIDKVDALPGIVKYLALDLTACGDALSPFSNISVPGSYKIIDQGSGNLGDRLDYLSCHLLKDMKGLIIIGADSPTLSLSCIEEAIRGLEDHDVTIGPSEDGGYYLLGLKRYIDNLFDGIEWSSPFVFDQTLALAYEADAKIKILATWYDVDTYDDLLRLVEELKSYPSLAPSTDLFIKQLDLKLS